MLQRRTPLQRSPMKRSRKPINPFSAKRAALRDERRTFVDRILTERPHCEGLAHLRQIVHECGPDDQYVVVRAMRACTFKSTEVHEILSRARGGSTVEDDNVLALCHNCHAWVTTHPRLATWAKMLKGRWGRWER